MGIYSIMLPSSGFSVAHSMHQSLLFVNMPHQRSNPPLFNHSDMYVADKTTTNFQYIYYIAFWLLENFTTMLAPNERQIQID